MELSTLEIVLRLGAAVVVGGILGSNREMHHKPAGLRTHALVALGAATLTVASVLISGSSSHPAEAMSRVIQGIVAGIGFLGAGAILKGDESGGIRGLTTAASIWVVAAIGVACGAGLWMTALLALAIAIVVLVGGSRVERLLRRMEKGDGETGRDAR